jgi:hypothetical protein
LSYLINSYRYAVAGFDKTDCLCYYKFTESSGDLINQATSENGFDEGLGSAQDSSAIGAGVDYGATSPLGSNTAYSFDGSTTSKITLATDLFSGTGDFSIVVWAYHTNESGNDTVLRAGQELLIYQASTDAFNCQPSGLVTTTAIDINTWYMVVFTREGSDVTMYLNASSEATGTDSTDYTNGAWLIGGRPASGETWQGRLTEISIWKRALSSDSITELYNSGTPLSLI